jgi:Protein kinase domain
MATSVPERRLLDDRLYIVEELASMPSFTLLLGYDIEQSALLEKPVYCYVRMVHPGHDWAANLSTQDKERPIITTSDQIFVVLENAKVSGSGPLTFLPEDNLVLFKKIGFGGQGTVYFAQDLNEPSAPFVAVKQLKKPRTLQDHKRQDREINMHSRASSHGHPNIVTLRRHFKRLGSNFLVMDFHFGGDLFSDMCQNLDLYVSNDGLFRDVMIQLIDAVRYLHEEHIFHWYVFIHLVVHSTLDLYHTAISNPRTSSFLKTVNSST